MTAPMPVLSVRDSQILTLLRGGTRAHRVIEIGAYRKTWTKADVQRVIALHAPHLVGVTPARTPRALRPPPTPGRKAATPQPPPVAAPLDTRTWIPPKPAAEPIDVQLSQREAEVLTQLCHGRSNGQIAIQLRISEDTVKTHVKRLMAGVGARDRTHVVALVLTGAVVPHVTPRRKGGA